QGHFSGFASKHPSEALPGALQKRLHSAAESCKTPWQFALQTRRYTNLPPSASNWEANRIASDFRDRLQEQWPDLHVSLHRRVKVRSRSNPEPKHQHPARDSIQNQESTCEEKAALIGRVQTGVHDRAQQSRIPTLAAERCQHADGSRITVQA